MANFKWWQYVVAIVIACLVLKVLFEIVPLMFGIMYVVFKYLVLPALAVAVLYRLWLGHRTKTQ